MPATDDERILALAREAAQDRHEFAIDGSDTRPPPEDKDGHAGDFETCPHPDCKLVRARA